MSGPILVTGAAGALGGEVMRRARATGLDVVGTVFRHAADVPAPVRPIDLREADAVRALLEEVQPSLVVATAYVQGDWESTAVAPVLLAEAARSVGADLVHVSSDALFAGGPTPYDEDSPPCPTNPYGAAKAAAEVGVRTAHPEAAIVRIPLQVGRPETGAKRLVREVVEGVSDAVMFTDDIRCPAHIGDTAAALLELGGGRGVHHLPGADAVNRMELAELLCARHGWSTARLRPGTRTEVGLPGPVEIRLDGRRTLATLRTRMRGAREFLSPDG